MGHPMGSVKNRPRSTRSLKLIKASQRAHLSTSVNARWHLVVAGLQALKWLCTREVDPEYTVIPQTFADGWNQILAPLGTTAKSPRPRWLVREPRAVMPWEGRVHLLPSLGSCHPNIPHPCKPALHCLSAFAFVAVPSRRHLSLLMMFLGEIPHGNPAHNGSFFIKYVQWKLC